MANVDRWLLPDGVDEVLPEQAQVVERLRRQILDLYNIWGYDLVIPPMVEFTESLLSGSGSDLDLMTFRVTDQLSGRLMGIRADITPQTARMDAHSLRRQGPSRLCYAGTVLHTRPRGPLESRTPISIGVELFGEKLSVEHVGGSIILLLIAGIDTTWSAIGSSLWHLANNPDDLARLVADRSLIPTAVEEFLRVYAPVTMARLVAKDHDFHGCPMKVDDWVLLPFPAANLDPEVFPDADKVLIDRAENRHSAFGLGIHRCLGSNLARLELTIAIEEFINRFPSFTLGGTEDDVTWSVGQIRGPRELPVRVLANK